MLSTAPANARGSMGLYGDLVRSALGAAAPGLDLVHLSLRDAVHPSGSGTVGRWSQFREIARAQRRGRLVQADIYHLLDGSFGYMVAGIPWARTLVTVHDLIQALQARGQFPAPRPGWAARRLIA